jgi:hypothetical protein
MHISENVLSGMRNLRLLIPAPARLGSESLPIVRVFAYKLARFWQLQLELKHELSVTPKFFGPRLRETIKQLLYEEVEGTSSGKYGQIIAVTDIIDVCVGKNSQRLRRAPGC